MSKQIVLILQAICVCVIITAVSSLGQGAPSLTLHLLGQWKCWREQSILLRWCLKMHCLKMHCGGLCISALSSLLTILCCSSSAMVCPIATMWLSALGLINVGDSTRLNTKSEPSTSSWSLLAWPWMMMRPGPTAPGCGKHNNWAVFAMCAPLAATTASGMAGMLWTAIDCCTTCSWLPLLVCNHQLCCMLQLLEFPNCNFWLPTQHCLHIAKNKIQMWTPKIAWLKRQCFCSSNGVHVTSKGCMLVKLHTITVVTGFAWCIACVLDFATLWLAKPCPVRGQMCIPVASSMQWKVTSMW